MAHPAPTPRGAQPPPSPALGRIDPTDLIQIPPPRHPSLAGSTCDWADDLETLPDGHDFDVEDTVDMGHDWS